MHGPLLPQERPLVPSPADATPNSADARADAPANAPANARLDGGGPWGRGLHGHEVKWRKKNDDKIQTNCLSAHVRVNATQFNSERPCFRCRVQEYHKSILFYFSISFWETKWGWVNTQFIKVPIPSSASRNSGARKREVRILSLAGCGAWSEPMVNQTLQTNKSSFCPHLLHESIEH